MHDGGSYLASFPPEASAAGLTALPTAASEDGGDDGVSLALAAVATAMAADIGTPAGETWCERVARMLYNCQGTGLG